MAEVLRTQEIVVQRDVMVEEEIRRLLKSVAYALRAMVNTMAKYPSTQLIFGRYMIIHQSQIID